MSLQTRLNPDTTQLEIGVDEAGRGPMFGRVYAAAAVLPAPGATSFDHSLMKDSKRFHSKKRIDAAAQHVMEHALAWSVKWRDEACIDRDNIRNATHAAMHEAIADVIQQLQHKGMAQTLPTLVVDGNDFTPFHVPVRNEHGAVTLQQPPTVCVEGGDNKYTMIAAASILAKVARDNYIDELCAQHPELVERYDILKNKGYGTRAHMDGIRQHGVSQWHRRSFGICKQSS
jgi:ribonuclease HII